MLLGLVIGILIYSVILTAVVLYKNSSSYFMVEVLDIVVAGPVCWLLFVIAAICQAVRGNRPKKFKSSYKSVRYINKVVKNVIRNYSRLHRDDDEYFDLNRMTGRYQADDICGWEDLLVNRASHEFINNKFKSLMMHQKDATLKAVTKYFVPVTESVMTDDHCTEDFIRMVFDYNIKLFKLRKQIKMR